MGWVDVFCGYLEGWFMLMEEYVCLMLVFVLYCEFLMFELSEIVDGGCRFVGLMWDCMVWDFVRVWFRDGEGWCGV